MEVSSQLNIPDTLTPGKEPGTELLEGWERPTACPWHGVTWCKREF